MIVHFSKYQGTGNDFVILDNRDKVFSSLNSRQIEFLCDRHFGIGADGLILLEQSPGKDFYMKYFNSDGNESSMCGNGGRCVIAFANELKIIKNRANFRAIDGGHEAIISNKSPLIVKLKMADVEEYEPIGNDVFLNTGSPHYVRFVDNVSAMEIIYEAQKIRYNDRFRKEGTNVNFAQVLESILIVRSYERGVEDETYSCGTGVVGAALASVAKGLVPVLGKQTVHTKGGILTVYYEQNGSGFKNVWLEGEATFVYKGEIEIN
jgi:diaminopimelate epimerase